VHRHVNSVCCYCTNNSNRSYSSYLLCVKHCTVDFIYIFLILQTCLKTWYCYHLTEEYTEPKQIITFLIGFEVGFQILIFSKKNSMLFVCFILLLWYIVTVSLLHLHSLIWNWDGFVTKVWIENYFMILFYFLDLKYNILWKNKHMYFFIFLSFIAQGCYVSGNSEKSPPNRINTDTMQVIPSICLGLL
jgi:hypothetical protein